MNSRNHALHSRDWKGRDAALLRDAVRRALHLGVTRDSRNLYERLYGLNVNPKPCVGADAFDPG